MPVITAMNTTTHHPKVGLVLTIAEGPFICGEEIRGKFVVESRTENNLGLATIGVELNVIQELTSRDHAASTVIHYTKRVFQGQGMPLSNAVIPDSNPENPALPRPYHPSRKGQTSFFFTFPLPAYLPSSIDFGNGLAKVRYEVTASVEVFYRGERRILINQKPVEVFECLPQLRDRIPVNIVGDGGKIHIQGRVLGMFAIVGQTACVELYVVNHGSKKTNGVTLTVTRRLVLRQAPSQRNPYEITDDIAKIPFNGPEYSVPPGGEGVAQLVFEVPPKAFGALTGADHDDDPRLHVKGYTPLFTVQCQVTVRIGLGLGEPDIVFTLPLLTARPETLPQAPPPAVVTPPPPPQVYPQYYAQDAYPPLEPPRPLFAQNHYSAPPSPQWSPFAGQDVYAGTPPYQQPLGQPPMSSSPNAYFPQYSSQPTTPLHNQFSPLPPFAPPQSIPIAPPHQQYQQQQQQQQPQQQQHIQWAPSPPQVPVQQPVLQQPIVYGSPPPQPPPQPARQLPPIPQQQQQAPPPPPPLPQSYQQVQVQTQTQPEPQPQPQQQKQQQVVHAVPEQAPVVQAPPPVVPNPPAPTTVLANLSPNRRAVDESDEGKGVRASRISEHLRYTSRNRSASPVSHRYPVPITAAALARRGVPIPPPITIPAANAHPPGPETQSPHTGGGLSQSVGSLAVPQSPQTTGHIATGLTQSQGVLSPRPRLSPSLSFTDEPGRANGVKVASVKSKRVEDLERMAEEVLKEEEKHQYKIGLDLHPGAGDKTLPSIPTSGRSVVKSRSSALPTAAEIFGGQTAMPKSASVSSGLDALERRLTSNWSKADAAERWLSRGRRNPAYAPAPPPVVEYHHTGSSRSSASSRHSRAPSGPREEPNRKREASSTSRSKSVPRKESGLPPMPMPRAISPEAHEREVKRLQKEAVRRVEGWAGALPPAPPSELVPWATLNGQAIPKTSSGFVSTKKLAQQQGQRMPLMDMFSAPEQQQQQPLPSPRMIANNPPLMAAVAAAQSPVITTKASKNMLSQSTPGLGLGLGLGVPKAPYYDVRSARGGKGGVVTAVTAIWEQQGPSTPASIPAQPQPQQKNPKRDPPIFKVPDLPASASQPNLKAHKWSPAAPPPKPPMMVAGKADPAAVNGTIAKPYLSSAASIVNARPGGGAEVRLKKSFDRPAAIPESRSAPQLGVPKSPSSGQIGVGQTKLKELIAKYQGQSLS